jgi:hypothetical protein
MLKQPTYAVPPRATAVDVVLPNALLGSTGQSGVPPVRMKPRWYGPVTSSVSESRCRIARKGAVPSSRQDWSRSEEMSHWRAPVAS